MVASVSLSGMGLGCGLGTGNLKRNSPGDYNLQPRKDHLFRGRENERNPAKGSEVRLEERKG